MIKTDYDTIADEYARTRRVSEHVMLEVGCGTAKHIHALH